MKIILKLLMALIVCTSYLFADDELGTVKWTENGPVVYAKGIGTVNPKMPIAVQRPAVIEAAKVVGLRNALEIIKGVNINSETTIENKMLTDDIIIKTAQGKIKSYNVGEPKYYSDGTVEIEIVVPMFKNTELLKSILPVAKMGTVQVEKSENEAPSYTGVIINCKKLDLLPALTVTVKDQAGKEVYSPAIAKEDYIFQMEGMVAYTATINQAKKMIERVGDNPLIIDAVNITGENNCDAVISSSDLENISGSDETIKALEQCRVIFVSENF